MKPLAQNTLIQNRYLIVHLIGKGGMGEVYLAVDQRLGSAVALKRTFFAGDDMLGNAFEREARTLARMRHPVLPKVSDHFGEGDEQYLVMEHISGDDLSKRLEAAGKPFPVSWVLFWADQLLDALSYLHTHEPPIIHRDIKPQNLKLTDENHIILLDFGLSKTSTGQTNVSQSGSTGSVVGYTPHYAPMEQIRGIGTSARSDLYSLAATLYQLLTNTVPVDALSRADSMLNELPDPIKPPHEINPEVPKVVSDVLLRAMEVSQEKRYANAREMQRVLRKAFSDIQQATTANTVAFSAEQAEALSSVIPAQSTAGAIDSQPSDSKPGATTSVTGGEAGTGSGPLSEPASAVDLDATMAYDPYESVSGSKQSDVRTEVFLPGGNSRAFPDDDEQAGTPAVDASPFDSKAADQPVTNDAPAPPPSQGYTPAVTIPFVALDQAGSRSVESATSADAWSPSEPEFFDDGPRKAEQAPEEEVPYFRSAESEPEAQAAAAPYAATPAAVASAPAKKFSGKVIAIIGAIAVLFLLGIGVAGGAWAYFNYGPGAATPTPTPEPSPEPTIEITPTPTIESSVNSDIGNLNIGNSNSGNVNGNSNSGLFVSPTPEERPPDNETETPSTPRPSTPRPSTPRPPSTPVVKPTRDKPVTTRTPLP